MAIIKPIVNAEAKKQSSNELKQKLEDHKRDNECLEKMLNYQTIKKLLIQQGIATEFIS